MNGSEIITEERQRQVSDEGYSPEHDDQWVNGELVYAAICYLAAYLLKRYGAKARPRQLLGFITLWPWNAAAWRPKRHDITNLRRAGALIAAEIDRLIRRVTEEE